MPILEEGQLRELNPRGWVVGHMAEGARHTEAVGIKWASHDAGPVGEWSTCSQALTLSVLVSGQFQMYFREFDNGPETIVDLNAPGRYVMFGPDVQHRYEAIVESLVLTVRWPSTNGDCGPVKAVETHRSLGYVK